MGLRVGDTVIVRLGPKATAVCEFVRSGTCRGERCGVDVLWCKTPAGKWMPVDPPADDDESVPLEPHWSTCPDRQQF